MRNSEWMILRNSAQCLCYDQLENQLYLQAIHYSSLIIHEQYIKRCLELAKLGAGYVAPNPMVGAVLVYKEKIIGEGYHQKYGQAHAEVNCISLVKEADKSFIAESTLYVSLEPCSHYGKTPPCTDLIIQNKIPKVIIGCRDPFKEVDAHLNSAQLTCSDGDTIGQGKGIEKLKAAGVQVGLASGEMENECKELIKRFFTFHTVHRPFVILKWAQTADGKIAAPLNPPADWRGTSEDPESSRLFISNDYTNRQGLYHVFHLHRVFLCWKYSPMRQKQYAICGPTP